MRRRPAAEVAGTSDASIHEEPAYPVPKTGGGTVDESEVASFKALEGEPWNHPVGSGGMRTGKVVGATDARGEAPIERALAPEDLWATVYRHLGIDPAQSFLDPSGRPFSILPGGEPIAELLPT